MKYVMDYDYVCVIGGVKVSTEVRENFMGFLIRREEEIDIYWSELYDEEMLDNYNVPNEMRDTLMDDYADVDKGKLISYLKKNNLTPTSMVSYRCPYFVIDIKFISDHELWL
jgi:hypothetical protein